jgi:hypothetical protein
MGMRLRCHSVRNMRTHCRDVGSVGWVGHTGRHVVTCCLQILPGDAFGRMMVANLEARGMPLRGLAAVPSLSDQVCVVCAGVLRMRGRAGCYQLLISWSPGTLPRTRWDGVRGVRLLLQVSRLEQAGWDKAVALDMLQVGLACCASFIAQHAPAGAAGLLRHSVSGVQRTGAVGVQRSWGLSSACIPHTRPCATPQVYSRLPAADLQRVERLELLDEQEEWRLMLVRSCACAHWCACLSGCILASHVWRGSVAPHHSSSSALLLLDGRCHAESLLPGRGREQHPGACAVRGWTAGRRCTGQRRFPGSVVASRRPTLGQREWSRTWPAALLSCCQ